MTKLFKGKYRVDSMRKQYWNYAWRGKYFITIALKNKECWFGNIIDGKMQLSEMGKIANEEWKNTPSIRPDMNLRLDEFQIMPDHFHAIIEIGKNPYNLFEFEIPSSTNRDTIHGVSVGILYNSNPKSKFGPQRKNLSSIVRGFKSAVTVNCRKINPEFSWQSGYHEELVTDDNALKKIRWYIRNNSKNWKRK